MDDIYKNILEYNPHAGLKILFVCFCFFYDIIADMLNNKKVNIIVTELIRKLNIY